MVTVGQFLLYTLHIPIYFGPEGALPQNILCYPEVVPTWGPQGQEGLTWFMSHGASGTRS